MSWSSISWRQPLRLVAVAALTLGLAACFRPLYGPTASGERLDAVLAAIDVVPIAVPPTLERVSHYLRSELIFDLNGSGAPAPKRYKLAIAYAQNASSVIVDNATGRAQAATLTGTATYTLTDLDGKVVATDTAVGYTSYDRTQQRFATVRAGRDAEIRLAKVLSEQIKTRLSLTLATRA